MRNGAASFRGARLLPWCKLACALTAAISGLAFLRDASVTAWWAALLLFLVLLLSLAATERLAGLSAARLPNWSRRLALPMFRPPGASPERAPAIAGEGPSRPGDAPRDDAATAEEPVITEADLVNMDRRDREMLRSIISLDDSTAREIMVPRLDMITAEVNSSLREVAELMVKEGHTRIPVYSESIDNIVGIVHSRETLDALAHPGAEQNLQSLMNPPFIIPENKRLDDLLEEFQDRGAQMAIVVDEYGGTEGLVTMEDLLEEIVGEIEDEFSRDREALMETMDEGGVEVDARILTEDVAEMFGVSIESDDVDTVGGYVYKSLGRIPVAGDVVTTDGIRIEVVSVMGRRLRKLRIHHAAEEAADSGP